MKEIFQNPQITEALVNVGIAGVSVLCGFLAQAARNVTTKLKAQTQLVCSEEKRNLLHTALNAAEDLTGKTVAALEQTVAKELRESVKDGTVSRSELEGLSKKAFLEIYDALSSEYIQAINEAYGSFGSYLERLIEAKVLELKKNYPVLEAVPEPDFKGEPLFTPEE